MHPEYQTKIYEEIENILPKGQTTVSVDLINQLNYTDRIVKETLRLFPIIPLMTRITRNDMKIGGNLFKKKTFSMKQITWFCPIDGFNIPTGTEFIMSIFDLHRTASIWGPNATKFDPNNFLPDNVADRHSHSFVPFGFGSRNCVGKTFRFLFLSLHISVIMNGVILWNRFTIR